MTILKLDVELFSYWQCGAGRGQGIDFDGVVYRDNDGLPYIPGKTFKGVLKDALFRYLTLSKDANAEMSKGVNAETIIEGIFGDEIGAESGNYRIDSARLPASDRAALLSAGDDIKAHLYRSLQSTAIDDITGGAKTGALRINEVAIPLTLSTQIKYIGKDRTPQDDFKIFENALPFFYIGIGGNRRRGLGRVKVTSQTTRGQENAA